MTQEVIIQKKDNRITNYFDRTRFEDVFFIFDRRGDMTMRTFPRSSKTESGGIITR